MGADRNSRRATLWIAAGFAVVLGGAVSGPASAAAYDESFYQGMEWRSIGPYRGGRSNASVGVVSQPLTFYFGGVGSGVWKTTDGGLRWRNVSDDTFGTASVGAIAVAPSDPNVVWVGMGEHAVRGVMTSHGDGVYRSTDAGASWTHLGLERVRQISAVIVHPQDPDTAWIAAQGAPYGPSEDRGIYRTRDGGATWEKVLYVDRHAGASGLAIDPTNPRILYAAFWDHVRLPWQVRSGGPGSGIWKSVDGGENWERLGETVEKGLPAVKGKTHVAVAANGSRVWALIEADPEGGLYRSEDGGKSWALINEDWGPRARAWYYIKVWADPQDPERVWITNAQLYRSIDGGKTLTTVSTPHGDNHHLWIDPHDSDVMINSNDGGANVSFDGGRTWSSQANQPTAQFYRVNVDNQFPYHVYGGQQDNSAIGIASAAPGGIGQEDFYSTAGCESAWAAFDPDDPQYVYGGCYMGIIEEWRRETGRTRDVMAYPVMPAAIESRDMKYRFNWSAPIVADPFDRSVVYHGGNVLLRSVDRGVSWEEISPDLTRNDDEKQGPGGGPITNEGAGGEIYGTIYSAALSSLEEGVIWTGSDDGLVHVTRDKGTSWTEVTPPGVGDAMVNALEASPHDPGRAYVALTRYKFNDFTPLAYRTEDFGASWTLITEGIPEEAWVRVVREDPVRPGLLYMGTELGAYVSFDDGSSWQSLALNMPVAAITDLIVQRRDNDLVAATAGRGFWILDDLSVLQQLDDEVAEADLFLFAPEPAYRAGSSGFRLPGGLVGQNPPGAATLDFVVAAIPEAGPEEVRLEIRDATGVLVKEWKGKVDRSEEARVVDPIGESETEKGETLDSAGTKDEGDAEEPAEGRKWALDKAEEARVGSFPLQPGMNRVAWDTRHRSLLGVPGLYVFGSLQGRKVVPGDYEVRLRVGDQTVSAPLRVKADPRESQELSGYRIQNELAEEVQGDIEAIHTATLRLRAVRDQVNGWVEQAAQIEGGESVVEAGEALLERMNDVEDSLIQKRTIDGQTVINFPMKLNQFYLYLFSAVDSAEGMVNQGARDRLADLRADWEVQREVLDSLLGEEVEAFEAVLRGSGIALLWVP